MTNASCRMGPLALALIMALGVGACSKGDKNPLDPADNAPTLTPTHTACISCTPTFTSTPTDTGTSTFTPSPSLTPTPTLTPTETSTPCGFPGDTCTFTSTPTATFTPTSTPPTGPPRITGIVQYVGSKDLSGKKIWVGAFKKNDFTQPVAYERWTATGEAVSYTLELPDFGTYYVGSLLTGANLFLTLKPNSGDPMWAYDDVCWGDTPDGFNVSGVTVLDIVFGDECFF